VRNFLQIAGGVDTLPLMMALRTRPQLWNAHPFRTRRPCSAMTECDDVLLRYTAPEHLDDNDNDTEPVAYPAWTELPQVRPLVFDLMRRMEAVSLGRVIISRLPPGGRIAAHADTGNAYVEQPNVMRLHVALQGLPGSLYHCGDETTQMLSGSVWHFNHREIHSIENNSGDDRVHLMIDMVRG
jgi:hypothetical protein